MDGNGDDITGNSFQMFDQSTGTIYPLAIGTYNEIPPMFVGCLFAFTVNFCNL